MQFDSLKTMQTALNGPMTGPVSAPGGPKFGPQRTLPSAVSYRCKHRVSPMCRSRGTLEAKTSLFALNVQDNKYIGRTRRSGFLPARGGGGPDMRFSPGQRSGEQVGALSSRWPRKTARPTGRSTLGRGKPHVKCELKRNDVRRGKKTCAAVAGKRLILSEITNLALPELGRAKSYNRMIICYLSATAFRPAGFVSACYL